MEGEGEKDNKKQICQVCGMQPAKYTCPGCNKKTCSLTCVRSHKKQVDYIFLLLPRTIAQGFEIERDLFQ